MDRRQFIRQFGNLGACAAWPAAAMASTREATSWETLAEANTAVIAVGGIHRAVFEEPPPKLMPRPRFIAINTRHRTNPRLWVDRYLELGEGPEAPATMDDAMQCARAAVGNIEEAVRGVELAFLIVGLGGVAGSGITPVLAEALRRQGALTFAHTVLPFEWEGARRAFNADRALRMLSPKMDVLCMTDNERWGEYAGDEVPLSSVLAMAPRAFWAACRRALACPDTLTAAKFWPRMGEPRQYLGGAGVSG